ncbi:CAP domain-containing protein [Candidatus Methylacidithermus pantelleriae]|uniref:CAP domain-containing protein n=1 Tax=Candidatus Methylacidithermus pantelleriae TaxID=2744239 RepID=UPI00157C4D67|nr:CAP domain-containing protein [Candidatus Methylacidithermus pantelleriae]
MNTKRKGWLAFLFWVFSSYLLCANSLSGIPPKQELLARINEYRLSHGRKQLQPDSDLETQAQRWAQVIAREGGLSHGTDLRGQMRQGRWGYLVENLFVMSPPLRPGVIMEHWEKSPAHQRNLLDPRIESAGIGLASGRGGFVYVVFRGGVERSSSQQEVLRSAHRKGWYFRLFPWFEGH